MVLVAKEEEYVVYVVTWDTEEYKFSRNLELRFLKPRERRGRELQCGGIVT